MRIFFAIPKQEKARKFFEIFFGSFLTLTLSKNRKKCKNILFGLLIQFESFDLAGNGLKRFLLKIHNFFFLSKISKCPKDWPVLGHFWQNTNFPEKSDSATFYPLYPSNIMQKNPDKSVDPHNFFEKTEIND